MERITSVQNNKIKETAALSDTRKRKKSGLFVAEGRKLVEELVRCNIRPVRCFIKEGTPLPPGLEECETYCVTDAVMKKISTLSTPQDIIAVAKQPERSDGSDEDIIIALDALQDPLNLGAILRSAEAFGVKTVVLGQGCCDAYSTKTLRGAMGSVFRLNVIEKDLVGYVKCMKEKGYDIIGTGLDKNFRTVDKLMLSEKKVVIIGNEGNGISETVKNACDFGMFIPMSGENESLNAAVAASIIMWENKRQSNG